MAHLVRAQAVLVQGSEHEHEAHWCDNGTRQLQCRVAGGKQVRPSRVAGVPIGEGGWWGGSGKITALRHVWQVGAARRACWQVHPRPRLHPLCLPTSHPTLDAKQALSVVSQEPAAPPPPLPASPLSRPVPLSIEVAVIRIRTLWAEGEV